MLKLKLNAKGEFVDYAVSCSCKFMNGEHFHDFFFNNDSVVKKISLCVCVYCMSQY